MKKDEIVALLVEAGIAELSEISGCSEIDIDSLEKSAGASLPKEYKEFILAAGHEAGRLFQGTDIFYRNLSGLRGEAESLLKENDEKFELPKDAFVISMHQGYEFNFFLLTDGDNPPVYQYIEGSGEASIAWSSFTDFLRSSIDAHAKILGSKSN